MNENMKTFRITYRMEVYINAETEQEAMSIFEEIDLNNLGDDLELVDSDFVELVSIDEE